MKTLNHHTKDKGDQGVGFVIATLMAHGIKVATPLSDHLPFDLIAISPLGELAKLSVKYRALLKKTHPGTIIITLQSVQMQKHGAAGFRRRLWSRGEVDAHAIYCPDTQECYFVRDDECDKKIVIRVHPPKKLPRKVKRWAKDCLDPSVIFGGGGR